MSTNLPNPVERWSLPRSVANVTRGALAFALLSMGSSATPALAAGEPDLAIAVESLPTLANPELVLKVTNVSRDVRSGQTQAQVVFLGRQGAPIPNGPLLIAQVGGDGESIGSLDPGKSTTFSVAAPVDRCDDFDPRGAGSGFPGVLLRATASVTAAKSPAGVAEVNLSNNSVEIPNPCQQYNTDVTNFRPEGVFLQVLIDRRPDAEHPREVVFRVRNRGKAPAPATTVLVTTSSESSSPNAKEYAIKALEPEESVTFSYVLTSRCSDQFVTAVIRKPGAAKDVYEDDRIDDTYVCDHFAAEILKNYEIEAFSGPSETLLVPYGIPYDITVRNVSNKEKFDISISLFEGAEFATPQPAAVLEDWANLGFNCKVQTSGHLQCRDGNLPPGKSVVLRRFIQFTDAGNIRIDVSVSQAVIGADADIGSEAIDDNKTFFVKIVETP